MRRHLRCIATAGMLALGLGLPLLGPAGSWTDALAQDQELTKKERRERAREERIAEYLRKKEEKLARQEQERLAAEDAESAPSGAAVAGTAAVAGSTAVATGSKDLPRGLARAQENVRRSPLGSNATVQQYLDMVDSQEASAQQLAAMGNFLAAAGMTRDAMEYYAVALRLDDQDTVLWNNVGTLHRQLGEMSQAAAAYREALALNPNAAAAHYNLGAVLDEMGKYKEAVEAYKQALTLDPTLGDPAYNPQAANNDRLLAVKLMLYQEQSGSLGLPLMDVPGGGIDAAGGDTDDR
jgi:tetratricopeptide (TPR) repeat protein